MEKILGAKRRKLHKPFKLSSLADTENKEDTVTRGTPEITNNLETEVERDFRLQVTEKNLSTCKVTAERKTVTNTHTDGRKEKSFSCKYCGADFAQQFSLHRHSNIHVGLRPYCCGLCKASFAQISYLTKHMAIHQDTKPHKCEFCLVEFSRKEVLRLHIKEIHNSHKCQTCVGTCNCILSGSNDIAGLCNINNPPAITIYRCDLCEAQFAYPYDLKRHYTIHKCKEFQCNFCPLGFKEASKLESHLVVHNGKKTHHCNTCGASFAYKYVLRRHSLTHTGEKMFKCDICDMRFTLKQHLKGHMMIHTKEQPFECQICSRKFSRISSLNRHYKVHE